MGSQHAHTSSSATAQPVRQLSASNIQAKLNIGPVDDPLEHEADRVADAMMSNQVLTAAVVGQGDSIQRKCDGCESEERETVRLQRDDRQEDGDIRLKSKAVKSAGVALSAAATAAEAVSGGGAPLPGQARAYFEPRFDKDFSGVRIHTHPEAQRAASAIGARAYTLGNNIAFAPGEFAPQSRLGRHLLAHELTHVVQQGKHDLQKRILRSLDENACRLEGHNLIVRIQLEQERIANAGGASFQELERDHPEIATAALGLSAAYNMIMGAVDPLFADANLTPSTENDIQFLVLWNRKVERTQRLMDRTDSFTAPHLAIWVGQILFTLDALDRSLVLLARSDADVVSAIREDFNAVVRRARRLCNNSFLAGGASRTSQAVESRNREQMIEARAEQIREYVRGARRAGGAVGIHGNQVARILGRNEPALDNDDMVAVLDRLEEMDPDLLNEALYEGRTIQNLLLMGFSGLHGYRAEGEGFTSGLIRGERESLAADPAQDRAFSAGDQLIVTGAAVVGVLQGIGDSLISNIKGIVELLTPSFWSDFKDFLTDFLPDFLSDSEFRFMIGQLAGQSSAAEIRELASDSAFEYGRKFGWFFGFALTETILSVIGLGWVLKALRGTRVMARVSRGMTRILNRIARSALAARGIRVISAMAEALAGLRRRLRAIERRFPAVSSNEQMRRAIEDMSVAERRLGETLDQARETERAVRRAMSRGDVEDAQVKTRSLADNLERADREAAQIGRGRSDAPDTPERPSGLAADDTAVGDGANIGGGGSASASAADGAPSTVTPGFVESAGARGRMGNNPRITPEVVEAERMGFLAPGTHQGTSARAQTSRSLTTSIRADLGETAAYRARLGRGEIGLLSPQGANIPGPDYVTAAREADGVLWITVGDAKSRVSATSRFGRTKSSLPQTWSSAAEDAISQGRLDLGNPALEQEIRTAWQQGRVRIRQDNVDFSPNGQGNVTLDVR